MNADPNFLPVELIDAIVENHYLDGDRDDLHNSSLIARSWRQPSQRFLLQYIFIPFEALPKLAKLLGEPGYSALEVYSKHATLLGGSFQSDSPFEDVTEEMLETLASRLCNVKRLVFKKLEVHLPLAYWSRAFPQCELLCLRHVAFDSIDLLFGLICAFPSLKPFSSAMFDAWEAPQTSRRLCLPIYPNSTSKPVIHQIF
ncbi:hypothetical protein HGRIS_014930 [Hohenbuehelia grisea]|uniref:F-box domain-containing protein n=1 Tax=Hohenbuehelia grisea TaxID=104357 RepID=A0ABR3K0V7_9AGAR